MKTLIRAVFVVVLSAHGVAVASDPVAGAASAPPMAIQTKLPPAPEGFVWRYYRGAVFLKPEPWNERTAVNAKTANGITMTVYAASAEEFSESKFFEVGLTLQVIKDPKKVGGVEARKMALSYLSPVFDSRPKEDFLVVSQNERSGFEYTIVRYRDAPKGLKPVIIHKFIAASDSLDSVHIFTFESPEETWEENWKKYGTPILKQTMIMPGSN